jgi:hypothetical protein
MTLSSEEIAMEIRNKIQYDPVADLPVVEERRIIGCRIWAGYKSDIARGENS